MVWSGYPEESSELLEELNVLLELICVANCVYWVFVWPSAATATVEGKMSKSLKKVLKKIVAKDIHQELAVADAKLGGVIKVRK